MDLFHSFGSVLDTLNRMSGPTASGEVDAMSAGPPRTSEHSYTRVDLTRLTLIVEAMWELMKERGLTDDDLLAKIAELDLTDGKADGKKASGGPVTCPKCRRPNSRRHDFCMYCGDLIRSKPFQ